MAAAMDHLLSPLKRGTKDYLMKTIVPTLVQGLIQMAIQRPSDPHLWLSEFLLQKSPQADDYEIRRKPTEDELAAAAAAAAAAAVAAAAAAQPAAAAEPEAAPQTPQRTTAESKAEAKDEPDAAADSKDASDGKATDPTPARSTTPSPSKRKSGAHGVKVGSHFLMLTVLPPDESAGSTSGTITAFDPRTHVSMDLTLTPEQTQSLPAAVWDPATLAADPSIDALRSRLSVDESGPSPRLMFS